ncbi:beta-1,3-galactosyltransferase 1-like [Amblyomma americanum]
MTAGTKVSEEIQPFFSMRKTIAGVLTGGVFLCVYMVGPPWKVPVSSSLHTHAAPGSDWMNAAQVVTQREISTKPRLPNRGGWAVAERCRYPLDVLVFVHASAYRWRRRATVRDTLLEEASARRFSMAGVFFVGRRVNDSELDAWLDLEADMTGDLVVLPIEDGYRSVTPKFLAGMRWVADHCPTVKWIVKIDDDVMVEPFELQRYFRAVLQYQPRSLHCLVITNGPVFRDPWSRFYVPREDFPENVYFRYCSGRSLMMTYDVMRDLLRAASVVPSYSQDDAYVTGDLALVQGVGHVDLQRLFEWREGYTDCIYESRCFFTHELSNYGLTIGRRSQWGLLLWNQGLSRRERMDLSPRLATVAYAEMFNSTRIALRQGPDPGSVHFGQEVRKTREMRMRRREARITELNFGESMP